MTEETHFEFAKLQLQQSIEAYRVQMSLLVQVCTVLLVADATSVGYAIQQKLAGVVPIGGIFSAAIIVSIWHVSQLSKPILATAINIENRYSWQSRGTLVSNFVSFRYGTEFFSQLCNAASKSDSSERARALKQLSIPAFPGIPFPLLLLIFLTLAHAAAALALHRYFHWGWFSTEGAITASQSSPLRWL